MTEMTKQLVSGWSPWHYRRQEQVVRPICDTLCSFTVERTDRFVIAFKSRKNAHPPPMEGMQLIDKSKLLDSVANDDDIKWSHNPFDFRPDCTAPKSSEELLAMIPFEEPPGLPKRPRGLWREFIDNFSASIRSRPARFESMTLHI